MGNAAAAISTSDQPDAFDSERGVAIILAAALMLVFLGMAGGAQIPPHGP